MRAAVLLPVLAGKDAVGTDTLAMTAILEDCGIETRVFCMSAAGMDRRVWAPEKLVDFAGGPDDLVIYHYSTGWPLAVDLLKRCRGYRVVRYHNITPPEFFKDISVDYERACRSGREEIARIARLGCEKYIGASAYNLEELVAAGAPRERGEVLAPFHRVAQMLEAEADVELLGELCDGAKNFLMVGRVAPNKGHLDLVETFSAYARSHDEAVRLIVVGKSDPRLSVYTDAIRARIEELDLVDSVRWIEGASEAQLKAAYLASHVFMLMSEHEGFCVPLIEAMALGTPIVARASSAIPETLGPAGISWDEADPWLHAASAARVFSDEALRSAMREAGFARYADRFDNQVLRRRFLGMLEGVLR